MKKVFVVLTVILIAVVLVASSGCLGKKVDTVAAKEQMFINGTVADIRYTPLAYNNVATYQVIFTDGRWILIGTAEVESVSSINNGAESSMSCWGLDKIDTWGLVGDIKLGHDCSLLFEKNSNGFWQLAGVETS